MNKLSFSLIVLIISMSFVGCISTSRNIPLNADTIQEVIVEIEPHIQRFFKNNEYTIGSISMMIENNTIGSIEIWFQRLSTMNTSPKIVTVIIENNNISKIIEQPSDTKLEDIPINIKEWNIDINEAISIAKDSTSDVGNYIIDRIYVLGKHLSNKDGEGWRVSIMGPNIAKVIEINPYTGEIIK